MPTTIRNTDILFNDSTTQSSGQQVAKAWARFNSSSGSATTITSYNVSSITVIGTGQYTYAFSSALSNANYAVAFGSGTGSIGVGDSAGQDRMYATSTTGFTHATTNAPGTAFSNMDRVCFVVFAP